MAEVPEYPDQARTGIVQNARFDAPFVVMNILAVIIASQGLFANSTGVVIGAMLIAMLLGPINGIALALVDGNLSLLRRALIAEFGGVLVVLSTAFVIGKMGQSLPLTNEILARTGPNLLDLIIALAGGEAGAYAMVSPRLSSGLVGVSIATALVPPLTVCAICMARGEYSLGAGGLLLWFTNFVAIQVSASAVMFFHGYHKHQPSEAVVSVRRRGIGVSLTIFSGLVLFFGFNFTRSMAQQSFKARVRAAVEDGVKSWPGAFLVQVDYRGKAENPLIVVIVRTPSAIPPELVKRIESALPDLHGQKSELVVRSILTRDANGQGFLETPDARIGEQSVQPN